MDLGKFYEDFQTTTVTTSQLFDALKHHPHCVVMEGHGPGVKPGPNLLLEWNPDGSMRFHKKVFTGHVPSPYHFTTQDFFCQGTAFTRVGICGRILVKDPDTGKEGWQAKFHRTISDQELCAIVNAKRQQKESIGTALQVQAAFKGFFTDLLKKRCTTGDKSVDKYVLQAKVEYKVSEMEISQQEASRAAKPVGETLYKCIVQGRCVFHHETDLMLATINITKKEHEGGVGAKRKLSSEEDEETVPSSTSCKAQRGAVVSAPPPPPPPPH